MTLSSAFMVAVVGGVAVVLCAGSGCKSFSCEELANCPRADSGGGGSVATGGAGGSISSAGGGGSSNTCSDPGECDSGFCVDGLCCDSACDGLCESCAVPGSEGTCAPAPAGSHDDMECGAGVCDGSGTCALGSHLASMRYGHMNGREQPRSVQVNEAGNVAIAGTSSSYAHFGGSYWPSVGPGDSDAFVARYDSDLQHDYSFGYNDLNDQNQSGGDAAIDPSGYLVTAGTFEGPTYFGSSTTLTQSTGLYNAYLTRTMPVNNNLDWAHDYGSDPGYQTPEALAVDQQGDIFVTGHFEDDINFGSPEGQLTASGFRHDVFVAKISASGNGAWARRYGDGEQQYAYDIALDPNGNVLIVGRYDGTVNFGGDTLLDSDSFDGFVVKLDGNGNHLWSHSYGGIDSQVLRRVASDRDGNILIAGEASGELDLGGGALTIGDGDVFVAKLDPDGNHLWSQSYTTNSLDDLTGLAVDSLGNVIITGWFTADFNCGGEQLMSLGMDDIFVCKLSKDGVHLWSRRYGDAASQQVAGVAVDGLDRIYLAGFFEGSVDFGGGALDDAGMGDIFLVKLSP